MNAQSDRALVDEALYDPSKFYQAEGNYWKELARRLANALEVRLTGEESAEDRDVLKVVATAIRNNCTPSSEAYEKGGDFLIYAVADWVASPPEWVTGLDHLRSVGGES